MRIPAYWFVGVTAAVVLAACSTGTLAPDGGLAPDGALAPDGSAQTLDGGTCVGELASVGAACPATFDGTRANLPVCRTSLEQQTVWQCQDLLMLLLSFGLSGDVCFYDAASHVLVGALQGTDIDTYCNQTSLTIEAGRTNSMCRENAPLFTRSCGQSITGDLATVGAGCPAMFDGAEASLPACNGDFQSVWRCQDLIAFQSTLGFSDKVCYYDATSQALVGAENGGDTSTIMAGRTDSMCRYQTAPTFTRNCRTP